MSVLLRFLDWRRGAENALKWYERTLCALARAGESKTEVGERLRWECVAPNRNQPKDDALLLEGEREMWEFLPEFYGAWDRLSPSEQTVLWEFYVAKPMDSLSAVERLVERMGYERTRLYEIRREALSQFAFMLFKNL